MKHILPLTLPAILLLAACGGDGNGGGRDTSASPTAGAQASDVHGFANAPGGGETEAADSLILRAQVALDRQLFSPGVIDGKEGQSYTRALKGFQEARGLTLSGQLDQPTQQALLTGQSASATRRVVIPESFARGPFYPDLPKGEEAQSKFDHLGYRSMTEALAERFHTTPDLLVALNGPNTRLAAGRTIRVPDIPEPGRTDIPEDERGWGETLQRLGVAAEQPQADHLVVDKSDGVLRAYAKDGKLIGQFPVTTGSDYDPLPIGTWTIKGEARNPDYQFNPKLFWDAAPNAKAKRLPPGPNGPVGVVWIDLSKDHYGIHGTPEPKNIGRTESHGCVRLTNWDAARVAQMVATGTKVVFQP